MSPERHRRAKEVFLRSCELTREWARGRAMGFDAAVAEALRDD